MTLASTLSFGTAKWKSPDGNAWHTKLTIIMCVWNSQICWVFFPFFSSSSSARSWLITATNLLTGSSGITGEKKRSGQRRERLLRAILLLLHSCTFCDGGTRTRHPGVLWMETRCRCWQPMGPMAGIQQSIKARHTFSAKITTPHSGDSRRRKFPPHPPHTGCEDSSPSRRQTHSTCSGSSVTAWPSLDVVLASLESLLLESRVVCCKKRCTAFKFDVV